MTLLQRTKQILFGLVMIQVAIAFVYFQGDKKYMVVIWILALGLAFKGLTDIFYYFTMARHMVGGRIILFQAVIILDFALFTASLSDVPKIYILFYLVWIHAFSGVIETLRAMEAKRTVEGPWKMKLGHGIVNFALALSCLIFIKKTDTAVFIYCIGLVYSGAIRIISAFRRTAFTVIEQ